MRLRLRYVRLRWMAPSTATHQPQPRPYPLQTWRHLPYVKVPYRRVPSMSLAYRHIPSMSNKATSIGPRLQFMSCSGWAIHRNLMNRSRGPINCRLIQRFRTGQMSNSPRGVVGAGSRYERQSTGSVSYSSPPLSHVCCTMIMCLAHRISVC